MKIEWETIVAHANEVLQILGSGLLLSVATVLSASATRDAARETSVKDSLLRSVIPTKGLGKRVRGQSNDAQLVFEKLETLLTMPYARDIVGYWDDGNTERKTLFDVVTSLRSEYVHMVATEYETIQQLYNLSILQEYRSKNVAQGKLPLQIFVQNTLDSVRAALQAANNTNTRFGNSSKQFDFILSVIEKNIRDIETRLVKVNDDIKTSEGKLRDAVIWVVADVIALSLATAALLATFGVFGPVASAVALATQIGFGAAMTAAAVKIVLDSMTVSELAATISSLQGLRDTLQSSLANLREVQPLFQGVVTGVKDLKSTIEDMTKRLEDTSANASLIEHISLTKTDAETIRKAWTDVRNDTQSWMEVINRQGISPITFSIKSA